MKILFLRINNESLQIKYYKLNKIKDIFVNKQFILKNYDKLIILNTYFF